MRESSFRVPLRWVLPAVAVVVFVGLWSIVRPGYEPFFRFAQYTVTWRRVAVALNAPAYLLTRLIADNLGASPYGGDVMIVFLLVMVPALASLWFLTGRWFDRRRGLLPRKSKHHGRLRLLGVLTLAVFLFLMLYRCFYFARGGIEGWHGETSLVAAYTYGITGWLALWLAMALSSWIESRQGI